MIVLGVVLLILGFVFSVPLLWEIGVVVLVIGAVLWIMGSVGRPVAGRRLLVLTTSPGTQDRATAQQSRDLVHRARKGRP